MTQDSTAWQWRDTNTVLAPVIAEMDYQVGDLLCQSGDGDAAPVAEVLGDLAALAECFLGNYNIFM